MSVRALFQVAKVATVEPPYDTVQLKVFYPARLSGGAEEQNMGIVPADEARSPFPIVILFNGINCGSEGYQWLAVELARRGIVVVTFAWVSENIPGTVALTPGVDLGMLLPQTYGSGPTASALPAIFETLERLQTEGSLAGLLNLQRVILGGHSAGGRVAIESTSPDFYGQVIAAFAYGAHTAAITQLGYAPSTILALPDRLPLLLMGGTRDGVVDQSSDRYGTTWEQPTTPIRRTFEEAIAGGRDDSYLCLIEGANHFSFVHPRDETVGRPFLDYDTTQPADQIRGVMATLVGLFVEGYGCDRPTARARLAQMLTTAHPLIAHSAHK